MFGRSRQGKLGWLQVYIAPGDKARELQLEIKMAAFAIINQLPDIC